MLKAYIKANLEGAMANQRYPLFVNAYELSVLCMALEKEMKYMEERPDQSKEANESRISLHDLSMSAQALLKAINSSYEAKSACGDYLRNYCPDGIHEPAELSDDITPF